MTALECEIWGLDNNAGRQHKQFLESLLTAYAIQKANVFELYDTMRSSVNNNNWWRTAAAEMNKQRPPRVPQ